MKTRLFAMLSLAGLSGVLAATAMPGCSSDTIETTATDDGGTDATLDVVKKLPMEAAPEEVPDAGPAVCPTTTPITVADLPVKWQPPPAIQDVCTQPEIDMLKAAYKASTTGSLKYTEIKTALGATCSACVFSPVAGDAGPATTWSVFAETNTGGAFDNRTASCFARLKDETCGRTRSQFEFCLRKGCTSTECVTDAELTKCKQKVQSGACKAITDAYVAACPMETELLAACTFYASIAISCSGGADSGIDAAPPL